MSRSKDTGNTTVFQIEKGVTASISGLTISGGSSDLSGGGLDNSGTLTLTGCTISGNTATYGGGLVNYGTATLIDSTVTGNHAYWGGGLNDKQGDSLTLTDCTISGNTASSSGGDLYNKGTTKLDNTIVADNTQASKPAVDGTTALTGSYDLIGEGVSIKLTSSLTSSNVGVNPELESLASNGGPTQTMALLSDSPAINAGSNGLVPAGVTTDEAGQARVQGGTVNIGTMRVLISPRAPA